MGIDFEQQSKVFQPFVQADATATRKHGGTGLGLAISAELVNKMGGRIWVESPWKRDDVGPPVAGSVFHFTIPHLVGNPPPAAAVIPPDESSTLPMRVLVAEDNKINQKLIDRLLSRDGHFVRIVDNGQEALEALENEPFDLVLMDVQMPIMDGIEATQKIRERELREGGHLRIVAITANALDGDREQCIATGMDGFLTKPIQLSELRRILKYTVRNVDIN